jgi:hypothetical protein
VRFFFPHWLLCYQLLVLAEEEGCALRMKSTAETPGSFSSLLGVRMLKEAISSQTRLKALIQSLEWTYGVLWKLSSGERPVLEWAHGWFNSTSLEFGPTLALQFYSIFKTCSFKDPGSQGYAASALQRDCGPLWWTSSMPQIPTDKCKAQFLQVISQGKYEPQFACFTVHLRMQP